MKFAVRVAAIAVMAGLGGLACDEVTSALDEENTAPQAVASASSSVVVGTTVTLDGTGSSDADGDDLSYTWALVSTPSGSSAQLTGASTAQAGFEADAVGTYEAALEVSDGTDADADTVTVTATNTAPVAVALPDTLVAQGSTVSLDASASTDADGHSLSYSWALDVPSGSSATLSDPTAEAPSFTADAEGDYRAIVTVSDGWDSAVDTASVTAVDPGAAPVINAVGTAGDIAMDVPHQVFVEASDVDGNPLTYTWSLASGPGSLSFPSGGSDADSTDIQVDAPGAYELEIAVSDGFNTVADTIDLTAYDASIDGDITSDTTLVKLLNAPWTVTVESDVEAALTINAGVELYFTSGAGFDVQGTNGALTAIGTSTDTIKMMGETATPGHWRGVRFATNNPDNELQYVQIAHGGSTDFCCTNVNSNIYVAGSAQANISNTLVQEAGDIGLFAENGANLATFSTNRFEGNAGAPVVVGAQVVGMLDAATTYNDVAAANGDPYIGVFSADVSADATWPAPSTPYLFSGETDIEGAITIDAGADFMFTADAGLDVVSGSLAAVGTASSPIVFRGQSATAGHWRGLRFQTNDPANELTHVQVSHGGSTDFCCTNILAGVHLDGATQVSITNSTFTDNAGQGVYIDNGANLATFASNLFGGNGDAGLVVGAEIVGSLDVATVYNDAGNPNGKDYIGVFAADVTGDATWRATDAPYRFTDETNIQAAITIQPGAALWFAAGAGIDVDVGSLAAVGTASDTIWFKGEVETAGHWKGLRFQTNDPTNHLKYVGVAHGGSTDFCCTNVNTNVHVSGSAQVAIDSSTFRASSAEGVRIDASATISSFSGNHFAGNGTAGLRVAANQLTSLDAATVYNDGGTPNGDPYIDVFSADVSADGTWPAPAAPYRFTDETNIQADISIDPGAELWFGSGAGIDVEDGSGGSLAAVGTSTDTIKFRGEVETAGYWKGLRFATNNPLNELKYASVMHGGSTDFCCTNIDANVHVDDPGTLVVSYSLFDLSADWDLYADTPGNVDDSGGNNTYNSGGKNF